MVAVLATFILAMVLYPDVLAKAQAELDRVVGSHRLPDLSDRSTLPYLDAIITETFRYVSFNVVALFFRSFVMTKGGTRLLLLVGSKYTKDIFIFEPGDGRCSPQGDA
jgi:hypothetical protein